MDIQFLDQKESLRVSQVERSNSTETNRRVAAELETAHTSVLTFQLSLYANKAEFFRLVEALRQDGANATEFQKALDESLESNTVLETGNVEALHVAKASDLCCDQNERELTSLQDLLHMSRTALADLQSIHRRCGEGERLIATLVEKLDTSEHRRFWTLNALSENRRQLGDAQADAVLSQEYLTHFRRLVESVLNDL